MKHLWKLLVASVFVLTGWAAYGTLNNVGAVNPNVTQANINQTICVSGWTATVRPPTSYTGPLKTKLCAAQKCGDQTKYELDHFVPIELGGAPSDPKNLWLQAYPDAHYKDSVENKLKRAVCAGQMTLAEARKNIYSWQTIYKQTSFGGVGAVDYLDPDDN